MPQHRFGFRLGHGLQQASGHRHQGLILAHAGGESIDIGRVENSDFRHADTGNLRLTPHRFDQPNFVGGLRILDHLRTRHALSAPLGNGQRDKGTAHAHDGGEDQQGAEVQALFIEVWLHPQQAHGDGQHQHDAEVGGEK